MHERKNNATAEIHLKTINNLNFLSSVSRADYVVPVYSVDVSYAHTLYQAS